jgi:hypothetical protein
MATVRGVVNFNVKPGRYDELFEGLKGFKEIIEGLGSTLTVNRVVIGAEPTHIIAVVQYADYAAYAKAASHSELRALIDSMRNNSDPPWESLTIMLVEEVLL